MDKFFQKVKILSIFNIILLDSSSARIGLLVHTYWTAKCSYHTAHQLYNL